jgi:hypothetical protein
MTLSVMTFRIKDTQHNDIGHDDVQYNNKINATLSIVTLA